MSVFHRSTSGFEHTEANRREVLMAAGGLAAATAVASTGGHVGDKKAPAAPKLTVAINGNGMTPFNALAFSWGASNSGSVTAGGGGAGKPNVQDLSFTKYVDANSPRLFAAVVTGRHLPSVVLTWIGPKGSPTVKIRLDQVLVSSVSEGGSLGEPRLTENVSINFRKITFSYDDVSTSYDIATTIST